MVDISKITLATHEVESLATRHQGALEAVQRLVQSPSIQAVNALQGSSGFSRMLEDANRQSMLMRAAMGPLEELRLSGAFGHVSELSDALRSARNSMASFDARFTLPDLQLGDMRRHLEHILNSGELARYALQAAEVQQAMAAMRTPWVDAQEALRSITAFTEIQGMGSILARMPAFGDMVSTALRADLGDWRDEITWTEPVLTDPSARADFYDSLGFDPFLTSLPAEAFQESLRIADLGRETPRLVDLYGEPVSRATDPQEEIAFVRTNKAHDWLQRLETNIRLFIDARMTAAFGSEWPKHRLPNGLYERWLEKQTAALGAGGELKPLIVYADFTDYERVICKADNWREVFAISFSRMESVRESFQRLHPIRLDTMHSRPIGQDDELLLYVEVRRIIRAIG